MVAIRALWGAGVLALAACSSPVVPVVGGKADLSTYDWTRGPVELTGTWGFGTGVRPVPDAWKGDDAGGPDGRGWGVYRLDLRVEGAPALALRWGTAATALAVKVDGVEVARAGQPSPNALVARPGYAPGVIRLPEGSEHRIEFVVSNHEYRVGGLWWAPQVGPADALIRAQWLDELLAGALAAGLGVIGLGSLLLFGQRPGSRVFFHLAVFSLLIALRALVTGEYDLVRLVPFLGFDGLIRLEYLTAFLPLPSAALYFCAYFPGLMPRWALRAATWPSWLFGALAVVLPLDLLTRIIPAFYPLAVPTLVVGTAMVVGHCLRRRTDGMVLVGVVALATAGLVDMVRAAFFSATGNLVPLGLGIFTLLQALSLARKFLRTLEQTQALVHEKDLLMKEVHHRVKNSLQVVASLLSLDGNKTMRRRVVAIAAVHEQLYHRGEGLVDVGVYLQSLQGLHVQDAGAGERRVVFRWTGETAWVDQDFCVDAGLIVTELVTNAQKHAGPGGDTVVEVTLGAGTLALEVIDDGPGFPDGFRPQDAKGLGFRVIRALLPRRSGRIEVLPGPGGRVRVELSLPPDPPGPPAPPGAGSAGPPA